MSKLLKLSPLIYAIFLIILRNYRIEFPDDIILQIANDISLEIFFSIVSFLYMRLDKEHSSFYTVIILVAFISAVVKLIFV